MSTPSSQSFSRISSSGTPLQPCCFVTSRRIASRMSAKGQFLRGVFTIFVWEIKSFFARPASYVLLLAASLLAGWSFSWLVTLLSRGVPAALRSAADPVAQFVGPNLFLIGGCTLLVPLLTMSAIADERRRGTWELLVTAPISSLAAVLGKFAALWCLFVTCLVPWLYYLAVLRFGLPFDPGPATGGMLALALVGATFVAMGLFCSGLCRGPASAAVLSLVAMGMILLVSLAPRLLIHWGYSADQVRLAEAVSCWGQIERFSRGVIEPQVVAGHVTICAVLLWLTARVARRIDQQ